MLRLFLATTLSLAASGALAGSLELGGGYGAIDAPRNITPLQLARQFCAARADGDMSAVAPFFAPKLQQVLSGRADGTIPWQSFEGRPASCVPEILNGYDDTIGVLVRITYEAGGRRWADVLNLERTPDSWWLNNVFYETGGNLRFRLFQSD